LVRQPSRHANLGDASSTSNAGDVSDEVALKEVRNETHLGQPIDDNYCIGVHILDVLRRGDALSDVFVVVGVNVPGVEL
jgi:hypothetical protein